MFVAGYYHFHCQIVFKRIGIGSKITSIFDRFDTLENTDYTDSRYRLIGTSLSTGHRNRFSFVELLGNTTPMVDLSMLCFLS